MSDFKRIVFAGTPDFAADILGELLSYNYPIVGVYSQPDRPAGRGRKLTPSPVKKLALESNLPVYQPESLRNTNAEKQFADLKPDLLIVVAYGLILPPVILDIPTHGCMNVHASLLPRWRGAAPIQRAIWAGDCTSGVCIMKMDQGLDTGPVYHQDSCFVDNDLTSADLQKKLVDLGGDALIYTLENFDDLTPTPQETEGITYAHKIKKQDGKINWQHTAREIKNQICALNPWPVAYSELNGQRIRIWQAKTNYDERSPQKPGTIVAVSKESIDVACGIGTLHIKKIQLAGGKVLNAHESFNSNKSPLQVERCFI